MESLSKILESAAKYAWAVFVVASFVLFVPDDGSKQLGLEQIKAGYKGYLWLVLVFTGTLSVGAVFSYLDTKVFDGWLEHRRAENQRKKKRLERISAIALRLNSLDDRELLWIKYCLIHKVQSLSARMDDVTAQSLVNKGILSQGSGSMLNLPFHIPDEIWSYLQENYSAFLSEKEVNDPKLTELLDGFRRSLYPGHWMAY